MTRRLTRSSDDRLIAGVCAGVADYLGVDPTIVRLVGAALTLVGLGTTILVYLAAWIIIPDDDGRPTIPGAPPPR